MKISFGKLLLAFMIIPFIELYILLKIAAYTSPFTAFGLVIITGVIGAHFARQQGRVVIKDIQSDLQLGKMPAQSLISGLCVLIGGVLLLTPGILTDIVGFLLILPFTRMTFSSFLKRHFSGILQTSNVHVYSNFKTENDEGNVIDVDYEVLDKDK